MGNRTTGHLIEQRVSQREAPVLLDWHRTIGDKAVDKARALEVVGSKRLLTCMINRKMFALQADGLIRLAKRGHDLGLMLVMRETRIERTRGKCWDIICEYDEHTHGENVRFMSRTGYGKHLMGLHDALQNGDLVPAQAASDIARHMRNDGAAVLNRANRTFAA
jgi:hypothetical protein